MNKFLTVLLVFVFFTLAFTQTSGNSEELMQALEKKATFNLKDLPLSVALKIMSKQYRFNYVIGDVGKEKITVNLTNVPLKDALRAILLPFNAHYFIQNNTVVIKSMTASGANELQNFVYRCKYKNGMDLVEVVKPLLTASIGKASVLKSNPKVGGENAKPGDDILVVSDLQNKVEQIAAVLGQVDVREPQIQVEIKLVERIIGDTKDVGINWPTEVKGGIQGGETTAPITQEGGGGAQGSKQKLLGWLEMPEIGDTWNWGVLTIDEIKTFFKLLKTENRSKVVSNPKITVQNNGYAKVNIATTVPIQRISQTAAGFLISYEDQEVSSYVEVMPKINEDGSIMLAIHPKLEEIIGYKGEADASQPIIARREVSTTVAVQDGNTLVLGGLIKETESKVVSKVFLLGDIPILGYLFRYNSIKKDKTDLLIFITPKIMK